MSQAAYRIPHPLSTSTKSTYAYPSLNTSQGKYLQYTKILCRICLEQGTPKDLLNQVYIKPCKCTGPFEYTHESCMIQWSNKQLDHQSQLSPSPSSPGCPSLFNPASLSCPTCHYPLQLRLHKKINFLPCSTIHNKFRVFWPQLLVYIVIAIITMATMGVLAYFQSGLEKMEDQDQRNTLKIVFVIGWIVLGLNLGIWVGKFFKNFLVERVTRVRKVLPCQSDLVGFEQEANKGKKINTGEGMYGIMENPQTGAEIVRRLRIVKNQEQPIRNQSQGQIQQNYPPNIYQHESFIVGKSLTPQNYFF